MTAGTDENREGEARLVLGSGYARLPERFFTRTAPEPVASPRLLAFNGALAADLGLGLDGADEEELAALFGGNALPRGSEAIAAAYAGHQFGQFVPQLGDGRAILLGEVRDRAGALREIQLKGSGPTPFSRGGDGRAALGPVLREYLVSEAMHALGIPTTRALAAVASGQMVVRDRALPGAILTRVAASHVRVGTFEFFAARGDLAALAVLTDHVIARHYPEASDAPRPPLALLEALIDRQALLVARWMHVGFVHGVMNTDNMSVSGETIDYGPCAFLDVYDPATVFSSIDQHGRYAYSNQPHAAHWNLARFAATLLPLIDPLEARAAELANAALGAFSRRFGAYWLDGMRRKLGLATDEEGDEDLVRAWLEALHRNRVDYTLAFRALADAAAAAGAHGDGDAGADAQLRRLFAEPGDCDRWASVWRARLARDPLPAQARAAAMRRVNPAVIPRNHQIERAIEAAVSCDDLSVFTALSIVLARPYDGGEPRAAYARPPLPEERVLHTFCGT
ncbi:MAG TPA: YdiU family protein [Steroidobacteraceae bacterium]|nr:YdiU family protein [Steroidobacteraceae bacterium]